MGCHVVKSIISFASKMEPETPDTQPQTQSQSNNAWTNLMDSQPLENVVWGRLYPKSVKVNSLGTYIFAWYDSVVKIFFCLKSFYRLVQWTIWSGTRRSKSIDPHQNRAARKDPVSHFKSAFSYCQGFKRCYKSGLHWSMLYTFKNHLEIVFSLYYV